MKHEKIKIATFAILITGGLWLSGCTTTQEQTTGSVSTGTPVTQTPDNRTEEEVVRDSKDMLAKPNGTEMDVDPNISNDPQAIWEKKNCSRGIPMPTLYPKNPNIVDHKFVLTVDGGVERAKLFSGDSLLIENTGCDYYILTYMLKSDQITAKPEDLEFWFNKAADLLLAIQDSDVPFELRDASLLMRNLAQTKTGKLGKEYTFTEGPQPARFIMERTGKVGNTSYMSLKVFMGPI